MQSRADRDEMFAANVVAQTASTLIIRSRLLPTPLLKAAVSEPETPRVFVNAAIKEELCKDLAILSHGPPSAHEARPPEQPSFLLHERTGRRFQGLYKLIEFTRLADERGSE
jgi:murein endopeptidase